MEEVKNLMDLLKKRDPNSHKGTYGRVGIIGGSPGMTGAVYLSCQSALRTGSGLVYAICPEGLESILSIKMTEVIIKSVADKGNGYFVKESIGPIIERISQVDALAIGPGMGVDIARIQLVREVIKNSKTSLVIDADGLNCLALDTSILEEKNKSIVITPHPGEMARLLNTSIEEIQAKREYYTKTFSERYGIITVLKGSRTIVSSETGDIYINETGNPGMATAGSGDVLTGLITSLLGQGLSPIDAAKLGAYIHGLAGDLGSEEIGESGLIASEILERIPIIMRNKSK